MAKTAPSQKNAGRSNPQPLLRRHALVVSAIVLLTVIVFYPSMDNGFTNWDDNQYVTQNELIKELSPQSVKSFFTTFYGGNYHPLVALSNSVEYYFWQLNPTPYHVINLLLHLGNTALVFYFIVLLTNRIEAAAIVSLFFGIHPMHVESVAWIAERKDVLYTLFYLGSMMCYIVYLKKGLKTTYFVWSVALSLLSLFSKSAAVVTPVSLILIDFYMKREWNVKLLIEKIPFLLLSLLFGVIALFSQGSAKALNTLEPFSLLERFFITSYAIVFYLYKLFLPFNLSAFYNFPLLGGPLPVRYYAAPLTIAAIIFVIYKSGRLRRDMLFGLSFYLVNIILVVQIVSVGMTVVSERYAYVSYIGVFLIFGRVYCEVIDGTGKEACRWKPLTQIAFVAFAVLCGVLTWQRCLIWKNSIVLFSDAIAKENTSPIPYYNRAMAKYHTEDFTGAIKDFDRAIAIYPKDVDYFLNRGASKFALKDYAGALADFRDILKLNPANADGLINSANAEAMLNDNQASLGHFNRAIELKPGEPLVYFNRGHLFFRMNRLEEACADWQKAYQMGYQEASFMLNKHCHTHAQ